MIINNENKKLSRNRKRRIERKSKIDNNMKTLLNKIKNEKKKKSKNLDKIKQLERLSVNIKHANDPNKLQSEIKELNDNKNLDEIKQEILQDYEGEFQLLGNLKFGDHIRQTHIRFRNISGYEAYINTIDQSISIRKWM